MIRVSFLTVAKRNELRELARDGRSEGRVVRRANALLLLNNGWSYQEVAAAPLVDDDTVRLWHALYAEHWLTDVVVFNDKGSRSHQTPAQESARIALVRATLSRDAGALDAARQKAFIAASERLMKALCPD